MKILIVDDDKTMRQVLVNSLASFYQISPFESDNIADAVKLSSENKPALAFVDLQLLNLDNNEHLEALKNAYPEMKIILMSDFAADEKLLEYALSYLNAAQLTKPFRIETLKTIVDKLMFPGGSSEGEEKVAAAPDGSKNEKPKKITTEKKANKKAPIIVIAALAVIFGAYLVIKNYDVAPRDVATEFKNISSILVSGQKIFLSDWTTQNVAVYEIGGEQNQPSMLKQDLSQPSGMAVDDMYLWITDSLQGVILQFTLPDLSASIGKLDYIQEYSPPGISPSGIYYDGKQLITHDAQTKKVYFHKSDEKLSVSKSYDMPVDQPCGLTKLGNNYYIADSKTNRIFRFSKEGFNLEKIFFIPEYQSREKKIVAFAGDAESFWIASESGKIYRHKVSELKPVDTAR